jgi:uncharacterized membrane protein
MTQAQPLELKATATRLRQLASDRYWSREALERALFITGYLPDGSAWQNAINYALLILGSVLTLSGVVFFFAYNWAAMHRFLKFGIVEAVLLSLVGLTAYLGLRRLSGKAALMAAAILVGVLQAVYGQVYQTGADSYMLFLIWASLIFGWVAISAHAPLWFMLLILINIGLGAYWRQNLESGAATLEILFILNTAALLIWEYARHRGVLWLTRRWMPRLIACAVFALIATPTVEFIFTSNYRKDIFLNSAPVLYILFLGSALFIYSRKIHDLLILTVGFLSLIVVITSILTKFLFEDFTGPEALFGSFCLAGLAIIAQVAVSFTWLRKVSQSWERAQ